MHKGIPLLIASPLESEHVAAITVAEPRVEVLYEPDLLGRPRYPADHDGAPFVRTPEQQARWNALLARAEILWDFDTASMPDLLVRAPNLRWVQSTSAGVGQFAARYGLLDGGLVITTASGVHAGPLAEFTLMAMLMFTKDVAQLQRDRAARRWERCAVRELAGQTAVILGLGHIGQAVATAVRPLGVHTIGIVRQLAGRTAADLAVEHLVETQALPEVARLADTLVLCIPHTPQTEGLVSAQVIANLKPGALIVNVARGLVIDEDALLAALQDGRLVGAALDVFRREPLPPDSPFWTLPNVIVSPHSASTGLGENARLVALFLDNLRRYLDGEPLRNVLRGELLY